MSNTQKNKLISMQAVMAIARKELKSYFDQPMAYVLLAIFTGLSFFFFFQFNAANHEASLRIYFDLLPWFVLFFVPAVTMRSFSEEYRAGTIETMLTKSVNNLDAVIGKFVGTYVFAISPLLISLILPISFAFYGKLDYGVIFAQYIGALLLAAALTALGLWASSLTKNQIVALLGTVAAGFFFMVLSSEIVTINLPQGVSEAFKQLSFASHMVSISRGVIDLRDIVFFTGFIAVFLLLAYMALNRWLDYARDTRFTYIAIAVVAAIAILNIVATRMPLRIDLTRDKTYTLSQATINIINKAKGPISITVYASEQLPSEMQIISRDVWDILGDYNRYGSGKIIIKRFDPSKDDKSAQEAMSKGIHPVQFNVVSRGEFKVNQGYFGLTIEKGTDRELIPFIRNTNDFEYQVSSSIAKLSKARRPLIAIAQGHGEGSLSASYQTLGQELAKIADTEELKIDDNTEEIPAKYDVLMLLGPMSDLDEYSAILIDDYVRDGGAAIILHDGVFIDAQMAAGKNKAVFKDLYDKWSIKVEPALAYDLKSNLQVTAGGSLSQVVLPYPYWLRVVTDSSKPLTSKIEGLAMPWASPISILDNSGIATPVLNTSDAAGVTRDKFEINPMQARFNARELSQYALAVRVVAGKGQALVVGDADFAADQFTGQEPQNISLILNAVDVFTQGQGLSEIRSKQSSSSKLELQSPNDYEVLRYGNIAAGCALVIVYGVYRLTRRMRRKNMMLVESDDEDLEDDEYENDLGESEQPDEHDNESDRR